MDNVTVSIYVPTYNHEHYIVQALDSILMQRTQYSMEILVGEDCSTDNTRAVLQAWEQRNPGKATVFYREQNMHKSARPNAVDLKSRCKGKYVICLEGDDFWTDPEKLEKQISFLETHPEYFAVAHNCVVVDDDGKPNGEQYPECKDAEYTLQHFASDIMPGQLTTLLRRNDALLEWFDTSLIQNRVGPGDRRLYFSILCQSRLYCMQQVMSAYRHVTGHGSSYSATYSHKYAVEGKAIRIRTEFARSLGNREAELYSTVQYILYLRYALRNKLASIGEIKSELRQIPGWAKYIPYVLKRDVNRILGKKPYF